MLGRVLKLILGSNKNGVRSYQDAGLICTMDAFVYFTTRVDEPVRSRDGEVICI